MKSALLLTAALLIASAQSASAFRLFPWQEDAKHNHTGPGHHHGPPRGPFSPKYEAWASAALPEQIPAQNATLCRLQVLNKTFAFEERLYNSSEDHRAILVQKPGRQLIAASACRHLGLCEHQRLELGACPATGSQGAHISLEVNLSAAHLLSSANVQRLRLQPLSCGFVIVEGVIALCLCRSSWDTRMVRTRKTSTSRPEYLSCPGSWPRRTTMATSQTARRSSRSSSTCPRSQVRASARSSTSIKRVCIERSPLLQAATAPSPRPSTSRSWSKRTQNPSCTQVRSPDTLFRGALRLRPSSWPRRCIEQTWAPSAAAALPSQLSC